MNFYNVKCSTPKGRSQVVVQAKNVNSAAAKVLRRLHDLHPKKRVSCQNPIRVELSRAQRFALVVNNRGWSIKEAAEKIGASDVAVGRYLAKAKADSGETAPAEQREPSESVTRLIEMLGAN